MSATFERMGRLRTLGIPLIILLEIGNVFFWKYAPVSMIYLIIKVNCLLTII